MKNIIFLNFSAGFLQRYHELLCVYESCFSSCLDQCEFGKQNSKFMNILHQDDIIK